METLIAEPHVYSISRAAELLGINRTRLGCTIDALGIPTSPGPKRSRQIDRKALKRLRRHFARLDASS